MIMIAEWNVELYVDTFQRFMDIKEKLIKVVNDGMMENQCTAVRCYTSIKQVLNKLQMEGKIG